MSISLVSHRLVMMGLFIVYDMVVCVLLFSGCIDDIVTVLAEEHGCLDAIRVSLKSITSHCLLHWPAKTTLRKVDCPRIPSLPNV